MHFNFCLTPDINSSKDFMAKNNMKIKTVGCQWVGSVKFVLFWGLDTVLVSVRILCLLVHYSYEGTWETGQVCIAALDLDFDLDDSLRSFSSALGIGVSFSTLVWGSSSFVMLCLRWNKSLFLRHLVIMYSPAYPDPFSTFACGGFLTRTFCTTLNSLGSADGS